MSAAARDIQKSVNQRIAEENKDARRLQGERKAVMKANESKTSAKR